MASRASEPAHDPTGEFAELLGVASSNLADSTNPNSALVQMVEQHHDTVMAVGSSPTGATNNAPLNERIYQMPLVVEWYTHHPNGGAMACGFESRPAAQHSSLTFLKNCASLPLQLRPHSGTLRL